MSTIKGRGRPRPGSLLEAEFRVMQMQDQVRDVSRELARLRAAAMDVLHALPEERGPALSRLRLEMAGRGSWRAA